MALSGGPTSPFPGQYQGRSARQASLTAGSLVKVGGGCSYPEVKTSRKAILGRRSFEKQQLGGDAYESSSDVTVPLLARRSAPLLARRNSGSPKPGSASRNGWNLGAGHRAPTGGDRVKPSPISTTVQATLRSSSPTALHQDALYEVSLRARPTEQGVWRVPKEVPEEVWTKFDSSLNQLTREAAYLRGLLEGLRRRS
eukprot:TRINITY_DN58722_c0_g1_i2.p1 TRINITY_DN58722_c0_g1~~TRINITY_DN58722_c0_g1_i2.p1  ORF type:complete len:212 (+),score=36.44 TRINITY_DN58722_c0_g1_i2:43-636(+)